MVRLKHLIENDFLETKWAGGVTKQLLIHPTGGSYQERDFDYRLSEATVENQMSDFTHLPKYHRIILSLDNRIRLENSETETIVQLDPFCPHFFEGSEPIRSYGTCNDFNLMYIDSYQALIEVLKNDRSSITSNTPIQMLYALSEVTVSINQKITESLKEKELLVVEEITDDCLITLSAQSDKEPIAIWIGLRLKENGC